MKQLPWEHDMRADLQDHFFMGYEEGATHSIQQALRSLSEVSSIEVVMGDDVRLEQARFILAYARDHLAP